MTNDHIKIGFIKKTFGNKGELLLQSVNSFDFGFLSAGDWIFIDIDAELVPFLIVSIELRSADSALIALKDVNIQKAEKFSTLQIYLPEDFLKQKKIPFQENMKSLIGYNVIDNKLGNIGVIEDIIEKPVQNLLQINNSGKIILIPLDKKFIKKTNHSSKTVFISTPDGLIDLFL